MEKQTTPSTAETTSPNGNSKVLWTVLVVLVIFLLALFAWNQMHERGEDDGEYASTTMQGDTTSMGTTTAMSSSDDVASLESDLRGTDVNNVDAGADIVTR